MDPRDEDTESNAGLDEEEEAMIDPSQYDVLDDANSNDDEIPADEDDDDDAQGGGGGDDEEDEGEMPTEKEPERDDATLIFKEGSKGKSLHCVAIHPKDASITATAGEADEIYIVKDGVNVLKVLTGHTDTITILKFSPDGTTLASGCMDNTVKLWSSESWEMLHNLQDLCGEIECLLWHPTSLMLVGGATDAQAVMWNVKKGTVAQYFVGHRNSVTCAEWASDCKKLITASSDGSAVVFNPKTAESEVVFPTKDMSKDQAGVTTLTDISGNGDQWAAGCEDGTIHILSVSLKKVVGHFEEVHQQSIEASQAAQFGLHNGYLVTGSCDCKVCVWNTTDYRLRRTIELPEGITCAKWYGHWMICGCTDGDIRIWDARATGETPDLHLMGHRMFISSIELSPSTGTMVSVSDDGSMRTYPLPELQ